MAVSKRWSGAGVDPAVPTPTAPANGALDLVGFELSLDTTSVDVLDRVSRSLDAAVVARWLEASPAIEEIALIATCQRVELLVVGQVAGGGPEGLERLPEDPAAWRIRTGRDCVRHLYEVAGGRRSIAVGEREIRSQVLEAASEVLSRYPRPLLRDLLRTAVEDVALRSPPGTTSESIARIAADVVRERPPSAGRSVVVIGAGAVGRRVGELVGADRDVVLIYRTRGPDPDFTLRTGTRASPESARAEELRRAEVVIAAARTPTYCLLPSELPEGRPLRLLDLGIPRNIDPAVRGVPGVELLDLGDLRHRHPSPAGGREEAELQRLADDAWEELARRLLDGWIDQLRRGAERIRQEELRGAVPHLGTLAPEQREAVDLLARRLVERLLGPATRRLRALPGDAGGEELRRLALELLRPDEEP